MRTTTKYTKKYTILDYSWIPETNAIILIMKISVFQTTGRHIGYSEDALHLTTKIPIPSPTLPTAPSANRC